MARDFKIRPTVNGANVLLAGDTVTADTELTTADLDTGGGTDTRAVVGLAGAASGGAVLVQATAGGALKADITTIAGTAPTTVGKLDVKGADGDVFVRQTTAANLNATVVGTGTLAVQDSQVVADNAGFTDGTTKVFLGGYIFDEVAGTALTENDAAAGRIDSKRAIVHVLEDATTRGQRATVSAAGALKVDGSAVTQPVSIAAAVAVTDNSGSLTVDNAGTFAVQDSEKVADNAGFTDGTTKVLPAGFIYDEVAGTALTENDAAAARINVNRAQVATLEDGATRGRYATVTASNALKVDASGVAVPITDNSGSLTVDAPVGTPVAVRLSDGAAFLTVNSGALLVDTELPAAAALADGAANPTTPTLGASNLIYNGATHDRVRDLISFKTAAAAPDTGIMAVSNVDRRYTSVSLGTVIGNTQTWDTEGADEVLFVVGTTTTGTFTFEVSGDGTNFTAAEVRRTTDDTWQSGQNLTPTSGDVYKVHTGGRRTVRVRTVATLGGTVGFTATLIADSSLLMGIKTGYAPHNFGYTPATKTAQYTTAQTGTALWTPGSGKRVAVTYVQIQAAGTTAGTVQLWFGASGDTTYTQGTDKAIFDGEFAPSATLKPGVILGGGGGLVGIGATDDVLRVTDSAAINPLTITVWGYEAY